jgi:hypothetical protein
MQKRRFRLGFGQSSSFEYACAAFLGKLRPLKLARWAEIAGPMQESQQTPLFLPDKLEKFLGTDGVRLAAGIRLNAPAQVITSPRA